MPRLPRLPRLLLLFLATLWLSPSAVASSYPTASESALGEIRFADAPLALPVTQSFITAMLDVATDIKKQCRTTEAFGWPLQQTEQARVNTIFNAAVSAFGKQGFSMTPQNSRATTRDITVFTAKKSAKELLVLWSAGETGLILLICQTIDGALASPATANTNARLSPALSQASAPAKKIKPTAKAALKTAAAAYSTEKDNSINPAATIAAPKPIAVPITADESATSAAIAITPPAPQDENIPDLPPVVPQDVASSTALARPATPRSTLAEPPMTPEIKALLEAMPAAPSPPTPPPAEPVAPAPQGPLALP